jgi:hypothetical protein
MVEPTEALEDGHGLGSPVSAWRMARFDADRLDRGMTAS